MRNGFASTTKTPLFRRLTTHKSCSLLHTNTKHTNNFYSRETVSPECRAALNRAPTTTEIGTVSWRAQNGIPRSILLTKTYGWKLVSLFQSWLSANSVQYSSVYVSTTTEVKCGTIVLFFYDMLCGQYHTVSVLLVPEVFGASPVLRAVNLSYNCGVSTEISATDAL